MKTNKIIKFAITALLIGLIQGCLDKPEIREGKPLMVTTFTVQKPVETQYRNFKGTVIPADLTPLSFRVEGELDKILVRNGQKIKKGQLLAQLDDSKQRQQLADTKAQYSLAVKQLNRAKDLLTKKMISQSELDELSTNKRITEVNYEVAKNRLKYTRLVAPFSGYVSEIPKESFESVNPGEIILSVFRDDVVRVRIGISNSVLASLNPDLDVRTYKVNTTFSSDTRNHILTYYKHASEPAEGESAFEFWLEMPQVEPPILPGTSANLNVDLIAAGLRIISGYTIPMTALDAGVNKGEFYVWKLIDGKTHKQLVEIVQISKEGVIISQGLHSGDMLVNSQLNRLRDNTPAATANKEVN